MEWSVGHQCSQSMISIQTILLVGTDRLMDDDNTSGKVGCECGEQVDTAARMRLTEQREGERYNCPADSP